MYRILFFVVLFAVLVPLVWWLVNTLFKRIASALEDGRNADEVIRDFEARRAQIERRQRELEKASRAAKTESAELSKFAGRKSK